MEAGTFDLTDCQRDLGGDAEHVPRILGLVHDPIEADADEVCEADVLDRADSGDRRISIPAERALRLAQTERRTDAVERNHPD
ncbi:hypothetical protein [Halegenticoccus tardaugens]|uniref:hypothetical protein n=1 Tax=Halegenticoccus tardaugens TaxID=2071624 RepID=UPI00100BAB99|nr:hypothetical protein [Halegenticoccus tardaugens]